MKNKMRVWDTIQEKMVYIDDNHRIEFFGEGFFVRKRNDEKHTFTIIGSNTSMMLMRGIDKEDSKGNDLYEGDILETIGLLWLIEPILSQDRDETAYGLCVSMNGDGDNRLLDKSILEGVKIGNIYENSDILDKEWNNEA